MKLASLKGGRDGRLVVVSSHLERFLPAGGDFPTLQAALDRWASARPLERFMGARVRTEKGRPASARIYGPLSRGD